jgi:TRAP-type mannitol/chloroaromatic compound transport system permease small subunit
MQEVNASFNRNKAEADMCFFFSLIPATIWAVIGYFILFASSKAEGTIKTFGQGLAIWTFVIALFIPVGGAYVTLAGLCPIEAMWETLHSELAR